MTVIEGVLQEEKERNLLMQKTYLQEISALPKGYIVKKSRQSGDYYYLNYRTGNKVVSDYLGTDIEKVNQIEQAIAKRKRLEATIKRLKLEFKQITRVVK